jgi:hypothetical protein
VITIPLWQLFLGVLLGIAIWDLGRRLVLWWLRRHVENITVTFLPPKDDPSA